MSFSPEHAKEILSRKRRGVYWSAIFGGAISATAVSIVLLILGVGLGYASISPWYHVDAAARTLTLMAAIWMIVVQAFAGAFGGYITGRLRNRWHGFHADEGYFRDTVHGFLTWAVATVFVTIILASAASHNMRMGGGEFGAWRGPHEMVMDHSQPMNAGAPDEARMDNMTPEQRQEHWEEVRHNISRFALFTAVAMMVGAFVASASSALGGIHRDEWDSKL